MHLIMAVLRQPEAEMLCRALSGRRVRGSGRCRSGSDARFDHLRRRCMQAAPRWWRDVRSPGYLRPMAVDVESGEMTIKAPWTPVTAARLVWFVRTNGGPASDAPEWGVGVGGWWYVPP